MNSRGFLALLCAIMIPLAGCSSIRPSIQSTPPSAPPSANLMLPPEEIQSLPPVDQRTADVMDSEYTALAEAYGRVAVRLAKLQAYARRVSQPDE